jgi:pSer/pThr/pTyr-binding forkhead associated (FHA) protein
VVLEGPRAGERIELWEDAVVGRSHADIIIIEDPELSRQHAFIRRVPGGVEIEDLGSLNGTWIDGRRIDSPTVARWGAKVRFGATVVEVVAPVAGSAYRDEPASVS